MTEKNYLISLFEQKHIPIISKTYHSYLSYHGLDEHFVYVLKEGIAKTSVILPDGREFNISYVVGPDVVSLLRDEVSNYTSAPFNVRIESQSALFFRLPRTEFWNYVKKDVTLQRLIRDYYRRKLSENIHRLQNMLMNNKSGAVCALLYMLTKQFGIKDNENHWLIDFVITNEDIAGFCGISTRNSVNRIIHNLKEKGIVAIKAHKFVILDYDYLAEYSPI